MQRPNVQMGKRCAKTKKATKLVDSTADCGAIFTF